MTTAIGNTTPLVFRMPTDSAAPAKAAGFGKASPETLGRIDDALASAAARRVAGAEGSTASDVAMNVQLSSPRTVPPETMRDAAKIMMFTAQLQELGVKNHTVAMADRLNTALAARKVAQAHYTELAAELERLGEAYAEAIEGAQQAAGEAAESLEAVDAARRELERLEAALEVATPGSDEEEALRAQVGAARTALGELQMQSDRAVAASKLANDKLLAVDADLAKLETEIAALITSTPGYTSSIRAARGQSLEELISMVQTVLAKIGVDTMRDAFETARVAMQAQHAKAVQQARDMDEQQAKAAQASKTMGCVGKVIGWVITAVSVVAAPFTGGASMALAAIGLALAVSEEVTGRNILGEALSPFMEAVLQPLIKAMGNLMTGILKGLNVPDAERIGNIVGAVLAAALVVVVVVAAVVLGKGAGARLAAKLGDSVGKAMSKAMPQMLKTAGKSLGSLSSKASAALAKVSGSTSTTVARRIGYVGIVANVASFGNQTYQGVEGVRIADMNINVAKLRAAFDMSMAEAGVVRQGRDMIADNLAKHMEFIDSLTAAIAQTLSSAQSAQAANLRHIKPI